MTDQNYIDQLLGDESRRSFMKKSAAATVAAGAASTGTAAAQEDDDDILTDEWKGLMFINEFNPRARFSFVSPVVEWVPNYGDVRDSFFSDYNTRMIRYENTGETMRLFVAEDAEIGEYDDDLGFVTDADDDAEQPQLFEMNREWTPFGDNDQLITVNVSPVNEDEEDDILDTDDWWQESDSDGGT